MRQNIESQPPQWMRAELHAHCNLDPVDHRICPFSAEDLIREAARLQYRVLSITCHNLDVWSPELAGYAASLGITLIPGMEVSAGGKHVLVYNFGVRAEALRSLSQIRMLARADTLVVAPHPYFPSFTCLGRSIENRMDMFDAIEISGFHMAGIDFNRRARALAAAHGKPLLGSSDAHQLWQLGRTYTWIHARPDPESVIRAVKEGNVRVVTAALSFTDVLRFWTGIVGRAVFAPHSKSVDKKVFRDAPAKESSQHIAG